MNTKIYSCDEGEFMNREFFGLYILPCTIISIMLTIVYLK